MTPDGDDAVFTRSASPVASPFLFHASRGARAVGAAPHNKAARRALLYTGPARAPRAVHDEPAARQEPPTHARSAGSDFAPRVTVTTTSAVVLPAAASALSAAASQRPQPQPQRSLIGIAYRARHSSPGDRVKVAAAQPACCGGRRCPMRRKKEG